MSSNLKRLTIELATKRGPEKTICPSEVARTASPQQWANLMPAVRAAAMELVEEGRLRVLQKGREVDISTVKGPIRLQIVPPGDDR